MILTVFCPLCKSGLLNLISIKARGGEMVLGYRAKCTDCEMRTQPAGTAQEAIGCFRRGIFLHTPAVRRAS